MEATIAHKASNSLPSMSLVWPLRIFMGLTFLYAGVQHLTDPTYFDPSKPGYIGHLITQYAVGSPLHDFLLRVVQPNAVVFGYSIALGESLIGVAILLGFLFRVAALAGLLLNFTFFLSATWNAFPFYFGSDIVFVMCWLTLLLAGPQPGQSVDGILAKRFNALGWLASKPVQTTNDMPSQIHEKMVEAQVPVAKRATLFPKQVSEVNKSFDRIKQQFVSHTETQTILEFVRAFVISLGVDRNDTPRLLSALQNLVNRRTGDGN